MAARVPAEDVQLFYQVALIGRRDLALAPDPRTGFEMTLLRMLAFAPDDDAGVPARGRRAQGSTRAERVVPDGAAGGRSAPEAGGGAVAAAEWGAIVEALGLQGLARELASNCVLESLEGARVRLRLAPEHRALAAGRGPARLEEALSRHLERAVKVEIAVGEPVSGVETPAVIARREADTRRQRAVAALQGDPGVQAIVDAFGGHIEIDSVRPPE
jgi:DNA polymerase-3 subunit gamma/tau